MGINILPHHKTFSTTKRYMGLDKFRVIIFQAINLHVYAKVDQLVNTAQYQLLPTCACFHNCPFPTTKKIPLTLEYDILPQGVYVLGCQQKDNSKYFI